MSAGRLTLAFSLLLAIAWSVPAAAYPGDLDPTFGTFGKYLLPIEDNTKGESVVVRRDGSIVVAGTSLVQTPIFGYRAILLGFTADGQPDPSFGENGRLILPSGFGSASVALQGDKVVAVSNNIAGHLAVYRLEADGSLDQSFGSAGVADTGLSGADAQVAIAHDGKIVVASTSEPVAGVVVARLLPDGQSFDPSFDGGVVYASTDPAGTSAQTVAAGPGDGVTVLAGGSYGGVARVFRYTGDGEPDPTFGAGGELTYQLDGDISDMALRPDGSPLLAGVHEGADTYHGLVAAFTQAGEPDSSFALDGTAEMPDAESSAGALAIDSQGRILVMGSAAIRTTALITTRLYLARYRTDGTLDPAFGSNGVAYARFDRGDTVGAALAFTADGRIIAATDQDTGDRYPDYAPGLMRFLVAAGPHDVDADGVRDRDDRCEELSATGHQGCPLIGRRLALHHNHHGVKGRFRDDRGDCIDVGRVSIYASRRGRDDLLSTATPAYDGRFTARLGRTIKGRVYALAARAFVPDRGLCGRARSETIRFR